MWKSVILRPILKSLTNKSVFEVTFFKNLFLILISNPDKAFLEKEDLYVHLSDEELVKQIVADNDPMLFGKLYDRYVKMVYNKCYGFAKSADEAEDLTQTSHL